VFVDILKAGNQAVEYKVEFDYQLLSFRATAEVSEQIALQVGVGKVGKGVFNLEFVISLGFSNLGGCGCR
jgi:hypothetical protein